MERKYVPLFVIYLFHKNTGEAFATWSKLQKILYLAKKKYRLNIPYDFKDYFYGPYDSSIQIDVEFCRAHNLLEIKPHISIYGREYPTFLPTQEGIKLCEKIERELPKKELKLWIETIKFASLNLQKFLEYIYKEHYKEIEKLKPEIEKLRTDIINLISLIESSGVYEDFEKHKLVFMLKYTEKVLKKEVKEKVKLNILISAAGELVTLIKRTVMAKDKLNQELFDLFCFLENYATQTKVMPAIDSEVFDADELLDEGEREWILQMIKQ